MNCCKAHLLILSAFVWVSGLYADASTPNTPRPNIVFFYADDLGYNDLACYGSKVAQTPRLDRLAREGTRFTQFYVSHCVCSPTRATAITGHFPSRHRIYGHIAHLETNRERNMPDWLDVKAPSLPSALQQAGYRTAMIGKWHLGGGSGSKSWTRDSRLGKPPVPPSPTPVIDSPLAPAVAKYGFDHVRTTYGNSPTWRNAEVWPEPHDIYPYADAGWNTWSSRSGSPVDDAFVVANAADMITLHRVKNFRSLALDIRPDFEASAASDEKKRHE